MRAFTSRLYGRSHLQLLLHWRWLVLVIAIPISLAIEILEGNSHGLHFLDEVVIDGLILPLCTWVVLTFAARKIARQFEREQVLEQRQQFLQRLAEYRDYTALAQFIVRYPASLLPLEQVALYVFDHEQDQLNLVVQWPAIGSVEAALHSPQSTKLPVLAANTEVTGQSSQLAQAEYRFMLLHDQQQIGMLELRCWEGKQPSAAQIAFLTSLLPEIALALALTIADSQETERMYREAQAHERRRLVQELHDSLAQQVFYLHLSLDQLAESNGALSSDMVQQKVTAMRDVAAEVYDRIRNNLSILRAWEQVNISEAVSELARVTTHLADIQVEIDIQGEPAWLSPHTCEHVYGVVREGLNNIVKHASAQQVYLSLIWSAEHLHISLFDDGVGFDPAQPPHAGHYGLTLMREAIDALHGTIGFESGQGMGTTLSVSIPLRPAMQQVQQRRWSQALHNLFDTTT